MNYHVEVTINLPRDSVLEYFQDVSFIPEWQEGFVSMTNLHGQAGTVHSKNELVYMMRGKKTVMVETILHKDLPDHMHFLYEAKGVQNWANNYFIEKGDKTIWKAGHIFKFTGLMMLMAPFMKKMFAKETLKTMTMFKDAVEGLSS